MFEEMEEPLRIGPLSNTNKTQSLRLAEDQLFVSSAKLYMLLSDIS